MLTREDNEAITQVGAGTVMGNFMREYWLPAMLSSELPGPDCSPVRVKMLGEELIAFRDTSGKVGMLANLCPHRGASLFFGRNEQDGIRCVYHGWKFDTTGACVDMPNEAPESNFKSKVRTTSYPCEERGDLVFVYMGSRETPPPLPDIEATLIPEGSYTQAFMTPCNWLQVLEGNIDTAHAQFLHSGAAEAEWYPEGSFTYYSLKQRYARFTAADTDYGTIYGAYRPGPPGLNYWRIGKFMFPCWTSEAAGYLGFKIRDIAWVPMDDSHTLIFIIDGKVFNGERGVWADGAPKIPNEEPKQIGLVPNNTDWFGRFNTKYIWENDFLMDREEQRELGNFTGMPLTQMNEDTAVQVSMGATLDRTIEHLGTTDLMIIRTRQRLLEAARAFAEHKAPPPAVDNPELYLERCGSVMIPDGENWLEYTKDLRKAFVDNGQPDPVLSAGATFNTRGFRHKRNGPMF